ncbi:hypothetical protein [Streptosporangium sp. OZ121]|uniref:hypothetical protein n=1 Tax=Streptosporangium sp. OZ121 TaxID=3444183 RepID=UPI003F79AD7D
MTEIVPTAIIRPASAVLAASPTGALALPIPMVATVGDIPGLRPRRACGDGGEVPTANVDLVDALPPAEWSTVAAWLRAGKAVATRRARLNDTAAFLCWLKVELPDVGLLQVTEDHLTHYLQGVAS